MTPLSTRAGQMFRPIHQVYSGTFHSFEPRALRLRRKRQLISVRIMCGWISLSVVSVGGKESVHVNVEHITKGTLFPFDGHLCTHWEYLAAAASDSASVFTWVRVEDGDRDGFPIWFIPDAGNCVVRVRSRGSVWDLISVCVPRNPSAQS